MRYRLQKVRAPKPEPLSYRKQRPTAPDDYRVRLNFHVEAELERKIKAVAAGHKLSVSGYLAGVIRSHLKEVP